MIGQKFGRLLVLEELPERTNDGRRKYKCLCDCGNIMTVSGKALRSGHTKSCGCWNIECTIRRSFKHGGASRKNKSRLYSIWTDMKRRCYSDYTFGYQYYGARGIIVCDEWKNSFVAFRDWAIANGYEEDLSIERIDNDGNYTPENCTWIPRVAQTKNRRAPKNKRFGNARINLAKLAREAGLTKDALYGRLAAGMDLKAALAKPLRITKRTKLKEQEHEHS